MPVYPDKYAVIDCNNFFVSCERVFNPKLKNLPVVVLSNNDGCVVSRSNEAKELGIPMCAVVFKWIDFFKEHNVKLCSANFALYQDMSKRVFQTLRDLQEEVEIYSIDEAFTRLSRKSTSDLIAHCHKIKDTIYQYTGIPISIGIGDTKTQAKLANRIAKNNPTLNGVAIFDKSIYSTKQCLTSLKDVWGIGSKTIKRLQILNINTLKEFMSSNRLLLRQELGLGIEQTWLELHGTRCLPLNLLPGSKKSILCSRTIKHLTQDYDTLIKLLANHVTTATANLREQLSLTSSITVFTLSKQFVYQSLNFHSYKTILATPTAHTPTLFKKAMYTFNKIYKQDYLYKKIGVIFNDLFRKDEIQQNMFYPTKTDTKGNITMTVIDHLNSKWGQGTIKFANQGIGKFNDLSRPRSPRYTTSWAEIPLI